MNTIEKKALEDLRESIVGGTVNDIQIGNSTKIMIDNVSDRITLDLSDSILNIDGKTFEIFENQFDSKKFLLNLYRKKISNFLVTDGGDLEVSFDTSVRLVCKSSKATESWQIYGPNNLSITSLPGGGLGIWGNP